MYMLSAIIEASGPISLFLNSINSEDSTSTNSVQKLLQKIYKDGTWELNRSFFKSYKYLILSNVGYMRDKHHVCIVYFAN